MIDSIRSTHGQGIGDLSRYFGGDVDISSVMAHSVEWDEEPGHLTKIPIDESKITPENRIPRVTTATWRVKSPQCIGIC